MATDSEDDVGMVGTFELECNDCSFEAEVEGTVDDALDVADDHREEYGTATATHFVDFERSDL